MPSFNADGRGYYFTEYAPEDVRALARRASTLSPSERLDLLGDEWWMARAGRHDIGVFLDLAASLGDDTTDAVTEQIRQRLASVHADFVPAAQRTEFEAWVRSRFGPVLEAIGLPVSGDPVYGASGDLGLERQFLHAARLAFTHPFGGERIDVTSPLPADLEQALSRAEQEA